MHPALALCIFLLGLSTALLLIFLLRCRKHLRQRDQLVAQLRQEKEETAAQAEAKLRTLFDSIPEGVLLLNPEAKVEFANLAFKRLLALTEDPRGRTFQDVLQGTELPPKLLAQVAAQGAVTGMELELSDPVQRSLQVNAAAFTAAEPSRDRQRASSGPGTLILFHDVSRLKQLESIRRDFVANVSHELRTPVSLIKGFAETLLSSESGDSAQQKRWLEIIQKHADRLAFLIDDLLTISRLESGQEVMNRERVELWPLVERVREDLQEPAEENRVSIVNEVPRELWAFADSNRLHQVLWNLVENSIKYGRKEGAIRIGGKQLPQPRAELWVADDGPGIPPESRERIFERFYRADKVRSRETGGTGLGLSIVKHIVQAHGGEVWVRSETGRGATFYFTLPQE